MLRIMTGMRKFAVVIPTYNRPELLKRAVASALNQTLKPHEVVIINDGETPIPSFDDATVRVIATKGQEGPTKARNLAVSSLKTETDAVTYLDDDDELWPMHLKAHSDALDSGAAFAFSKALYKWPNLYHSIDPEPNNNGPKRYYDPNALLEQNIAPVSSFSHTKEAFFEVGGWDTTILRMEDWDFWGRLFIRYGPPKFVDEITNAISKGLDDNRTDSSRFVYSMACSWRDIVADRLKYMASNKKCKITEYELERFHIPKVGVVMPVYNAAKYLGQALDSILDQTFKDHEIIIVNDGSTDESRQIICAYKDPRIRLFDMPGGNSGVTKALNYGLLLSRSEYIARMDADDVSSTDRFRQQVEFLDRNKDVMLVGTGFLSMDEELKTVNWANVVETSPDDIKKTLLERCCIGHPTVMMRRRMIEILGGYSESPDCHAVEDYELWLRASQRFKLANIPYFLLKYREYGGQISRSLRSVQQTNFEKVRSSYRDKK